MNFIYSVVETVEDLKDPKIFRLSVINGIIWSVIWLLIALFTWHYMTRFTDMLITILPFKFVQSSGAEFIYMILWLQTVLISIGFVFSVFNQMLSKKTFSIIITFFIALFWFIVFIYYKNSIVGYIEKLIKIFPFTSIEDAVSVFLALFAYYSFYVFSMYIGFLFISDKYLIEKLQQDYPSEEIFNNISFFKIAALFFKNLFKFTVIFIIIYPLFFIPYINLIIILALWSYIIKDIMLDELFINFSHESFKNKRLFIIVLISVFLNFIPLVNIYAPALTILSLYHYILEDNTKSVI